MPLLHTYLHRPLVFLDLESTDNKLPAARICEIYLRKLHPSGQWEELHHFVNPRAEVHPEALKVHGLTNDHLSQFPAFEYVAPEVHAFLLGCDVAGYAVGMFDVPLLNLELDRCGWLVWPTEDVQVVDACTIYKKQNPRDLAAALRHYTGQALVGAHGAKADVHAAIGVLHSQVEAHAEEMGSTPADWHRYCFGPNTRVDAAGKLVRTPQGEVLLNFGKHKGEPLLSANGRGFAGWMLRSRDFAKDTLAKVCELLA